MAWYKPWTWGDESKSQTEQRDKLIGEGDASSAFAGQGEAGFGQLGAEAGGERDYLRRIARGQESVSAEQLRQGLQQTMAQQQSMAAGAAPQNAAMAARTAAMQSARLGSGMAGQQAVAGMQERQMAAKQLQDAILQQRQQDLQAALGSRQNAQGAYGGYKPEGSFLDKWGGAIGGAAAVAAKSDRRAKEEIEDGEVDANKALEGLRAYTFKYRDKKDGEGRQFGVMAQELERAGLKHAVIDTPAGKYVHGAKLATANTALTAALARRVAKLEGKGK